LKFPQPQKVTTILAFDILVKLHFLLKNTIHSFFLPHVPTLSTTTIAFVVIGVHGGIDNKFQLLVVNGSSFLAIDFKLYFGFVIVLFC
jgi:hypothetical protein